MRRALLTTGAGGLTVGNFGTFGTSLFAARLAIDLSGPASATGTIASVDTMAVATASEVRILTGSVSGFNFTVTAVSAAFTAASGANNYTVSLPIAAGDYIAYWCAQTTQSLNYATGAETMGFNSNPTSAPSVGAVLPFSTTTGRYSIRGTG